jgi:glyoxylase-like metal-dependent hydrolase (beta-lactamase superfamily II)
VSGDRALVQADGPVWRVTNGVFPSNCYIVPTGAEGRCVVVDPGLDGAAIEQATSALGLSPAAVLCTHGHFDHAGSAARFQQLGCPVYLHEPDLKTLRSSNFLLMAFKVPARIEVPPIEAVESHGFRLSFDLLDIVFHPAPGHTPGSCVIQCGRSLFTGDTLYSRGVGLSRLPGEDPQRLRESILTLWERFPDDAMVHPGHGDSAALGWIKRNNAPLLRFLEMPGQVLHQT